MKKASQISLQHCLGPCTNEKGFVLIVAMLMLLVISLMGIFMSNTTTTEVIIAGNERHSQEQFFKADAGVNTVIAANVAPGDGALPFPVIYTTAQPFNCNTPGHGPFSNYDIDGDGAIDVRIYLLEKFGSPPQTQIASCVTGNNSTAQIITGIQYGANLGSKKGTGDPNEYSN